MENASCLVSAPLGRSFGVCVADSPDNSAGHRARLRQRLFDGGGKALLDHELVEYLLALAIPRRDTKKDAKALIDKFGGLGPLLWADAETLRREGLTDGMVGALKIAEASALPVGYVSVFWHERAQKPFCRARRWLEIPGWRT